MDQPVVNMAVTFLPSPPGSLLTIPARDSGQTGKERQGPGKEKQLIILTARCLVCRMQNANTGNILNHGWNGNLSLMSDDDGRELIALKKNCLKFMIDRGLQDELWRSLINELVWSLICSLILQTDTDHLLCVRLCTRHWQHREEIGP